MGEQRTHRIQNSQICESGKKRKRTWTSIATRASPKAQYPNFSPRPKRDAEREVTGIKYWWYLGW